MESSYITPRISGFNGCHKASTDGKYKCVTVFHGLTSEEESDSLNPERLQSLESTLRRGRIEARGIPRVRHGATRCYPNFVKKWYPIARHRQQQTDHGTQNMHSNQIDTDGVTRRRALRGIGTGVGLVALGAAGSNPVVADPSSGSGQSDENGSGRTAAHPYAFPQNHFDAANSGNVLPTEAPTDDVAVKWKYDMGHKSPNGCVVGDNTVYIGNWDETFFALDAETGEERWTYNPEGKGGDVVSAGALYDGKVYFTNVSPNSINALDAETGEVEWIVKGSELYDRDDIATVSVRRPTVADDTVFVASDMNSESDEDGEIEEVDSVNALDADTGEQLWRFDGMDHMAQGALAYYKKDQTATVYVSSRDHSLYAVDAETGEERWSFQMDHYGYPAPSVKDGTVYVGTVFHNEKGRDAGHLYALDAETGGERWEHTTPDDGMVNPPVVVDDIVYYGNYDTAAGPWGPHEHEHNGMYAYDPEADEHIWHTKTSQVHGAPVIARGTLYCTAWDKVYGIDIETGDIHWTFQADDVVIGDPAVVGGTVYVASDDNHVYALEEAE